MESVIKALESGSYFGLVLTLGTFYLGRWIVRKTGLKAIHPMVVSILLVAAAHLLFGLDYGVYYQSASVLNFLLGPTTVALAVPLYRQFQVLKRNWLVILLAVSCGAISALLFLFGLSLLLKLEPDLYRSILTKSITTAIALGITQEFGGYPELTIFGITVTGITGATLGLIACRLFGIRERVAVGLAMGTSAHAIGTSCALEVGDVEGSMSSLALVTAGLITVVCAPFIGYWL